MRYCTECEEVPTLGRLPNLRVLEINGMHKVSSIGSEFYGYNDGSYKNTSTLFLALGILKLQYMFGLDEWKDARELRSAGEVLVFPCLEKLTLFYCIQLRDLPNSLHTCVSLQKLEVWECRELRYLAGVPSMIRSGLQCVEYMENGDCHLPSSTSSIHPSPKAQIV